ncbi:MAG: beta(1,3)galactosyltransferase EpsH [Bacilli bacterium]|nr:beta(1,3)galactosyltransferase EpsH [Bacilli bacterium]
MILVTVGTQDKSFKRLINEIDRLVKEKKIKDKVIMQTGYTEYNGLIEHFNFAPEDELNEMVKKCDILITHAGVGSIFKGLEYGKKVIAIPRLKKYHEHVNNHQLDISKNFLEAGYIKVVNDIADLGNTIKNINKFNPKKLEIDNQELIDTVEEFIDKI